MIGRNDLCTCGSGKKYKKCCLNKDKKNSILTNKLEFAQKYDLMLSKDLFEYSRNQKFYNDYLKAKEKFFIVTENEINEKFNNLFNTYYTQDYITDNNKAIGVLFYEQNQHKLNGVEREILRSRLNSYISIYEVTTICEDKVTLRDILLNEETYIDDVNILKDLKVGEIVIGRIANIAQVNKFIDTVFSISVSVKDAIIKDVVRIYENNKDVYTNIKHFLIYNTNIFYKYIQQLIEPKVGEYLKEQKQENNKLEETISEKETAIAQEEGCKIESLLKENVETDMLEVALTAWEEYKNNNAEIKGSESGWASAFEYHIKKENGINATQGDIAKKYNVSSSTLGKRYKDIKESCKKIAN